MLLAIYSTEDIRYFDVQSKEWRKLPLVQPPTKGAGIYCAEPIGNYLYVADSNTDFSCYDMVKESWSTPNMESWRTLQRSGAPSPLYRGSLCHVEDHLYVICKCSKSYRYSLADDDWQPLKSSEVVFQLGQNTFCYKAAAVYKSFIYVLYVQRVEGDQGSSDISRQYNSQLYRFDPKKNEWNPKALTQKPHFGSSLLVVNNKLYVVGGKCSFTASHNCEPDGSSAAIEVYDDEKDAWSVVQQRPVLPKDDLGAVEIDGRVYFIINSFPVDSGITIPQEQAYQLKLGQWKNLLNISKNAVLCYMPVKNSLLENKMKVN